MNAENGQEEKGSVQKIELHSRASLASLVVELDPMDDPLIYLMADRPDLIRWGARVFQRVTDFYYVEALEVRAVTDPNEKRLKGGA